MKSFGLTLALAVTSSACVTALAQQEPRRPNFVFIQGEGQGRLGKRSVGLCSRRVAKWPEPRHPHVNATLARCGNGRALGQLTKQTPRRGKRGRYDVAERLGPRPLGCLRFKPAHWTASREGIRRKELQSIVGAPLFAVDSVDSIDTFDLNPASACFVSTLSTALTRADSPAFNHRRWAPASHRDAAAKAQLAADRPKTADPRPPTRQTL